MRPASRSSAGGACASSSGPDGTGRPHRPAGGPLPPRAVPDSGLAGPPSRARRLPRFGSTTATLTAAASPSRAGSTAAARPRLAPLHLSPVPATQPITIGPTDWTVVTERLRHATASEFRLTGELGRGGMAIVYAAEDLALERRVAIKVLSPELLAFPGMVDRFRLEARTVARLRHPNIVTIHQVAERAGLYFFVMEYVHGRSLQQLMTAGTPLPRDFIYSVLRQVGSALAEVHRHGVVHRDVKPANILVEERGRAVLSDFGIARVAEQAGCTQVGQVIGTPEYMSPEQCLGRPAIGGASDQYSLGIVAYALMAGAPPFTGPATAVMHAHCATEPPPIVVPERCPDHTWEVLARMLAKDDGARWPDVSAAVEALDRSVSATIPHTRRQSAAAGVPDVRGASGAPTFGRRATAAGAALLLTAALTTLGTHFPSSEADHRPTPTPSAGAPKPNAETVRPLMAAARTADSLSRAGAFDEATAVLANVTDSLAVLSSSGDVAPPLLQPLRDSVSAVSERHRQSCFAYSDLLARRGRATPRCR